MVDAHKKQTVIYPGSPMPGHIEKDVSEMKNLLLLGYIVLLVMVAGMILDSYRFKSATYGEWRDEVREQNRKINLMMNPVCQSL